MKYKNDSLGNRMKGYENETRYYLTGKDPIIIRLDGKAFHTFTKGFRKPFDRILEMTMRKTMLYLCENIQGVTFAYTQSDEISLLLANINMTPEYQHWFNGNIQKMASVSASMATLIFNKEFHSNIMGESKKLYTEDCSEEDMDYIYTLENAMKKGAMFDARVFSIPHHEVINYFIWRQQDAIRNSKQAVGQAHFSQNQLHGKNCDQICEMLRNEKGIDWNDLPIYQQRGTCAEKRRYQYAAFNEKESNKIEPFDFYERSVWEPDLSIPIFTENRGYVMKHAGPTPEEQDLWDAFWRDL